VDAVHRDFCRGTDEGLTTIALPTSSRWPPPEPGLKAHPHMLRHACGYALANMGHDNRAIQGWLGLNPNPPASSADFSWHDLFLSLPRRACASGTKSWRQSFFWPEIPWDDGTVPLTLHAKDLGPRIKMPPPGLERRHGCIVPHEQRRSPPRRAPPAPRPGHRRTPTRRTPTRRSRIPPPYPNHPRVPPRARRGAKALWHPGSGDGVAGDSDGMVSKKAAQRERCGRPYGVFAPDGPAPHCGVEGAGCS
jgi:hypothetical protein